MASGGKRPGSGRPKGRPNKTSIAREQRVASTGPTPLDVMIEAMRYFRGLSTRHQPSGPQPDEKKLTLYLEKAAAIAKDAAPYIHPKLAQTTLRGDDSNPIRAKVEVEYV